MSLRDSVLETLVDPDVEKAFDSLEHQVNELGYDPWGFHPEKAKAYYSIGRQVYRYFRPIVNGAENIPKGRVLLVPNHSGQLPFDGIVVGIACLLDSPEPRIVRAMAERWVPTIPFINEFFSRSGVALGDPINCRNLLEADNAILVFPEGSRGCGKLWKDRYQLTHFGRGFMRLALQTNTPIVPVSVVGAEESIISIHNAKFLAKLFGAPYFPISPLLPVLGPLAYLPMPAQFHITFGKPMVFKGPFDDEDETIDKKVNRVKGRIQDMINESLANRESVFG